MKIYELGQIPLSERVEYPYAVAKDGEVVRFSNKVSAEFHASLLDHPQLFVAVPGAEWRANAAIPGWRQVTWFA